MRCWPRYLVTMIATAIVAILGTSLYFKSHIGEHRDDAVALIQKLTHGQVKIIRSFHVLGALQGFIVSPIKNPNQRSILYTDRTGRLLFSGNVINAKGQNLNQLAYKQYIAPKTADAAYQKIANTHWFEQGKATAPHKLYVVVDPNCIFCHLFYNAVQPLIQSGQVAIRWLVIGIIKPSSPGKAMRLLSAENPNQALAENEKTFNVKTEEGALKPIQHPSVAQKALLKTNNDFAEDLQITETPTFFYKTSQGETHMQAGLNLKELKAFIAKTGNQF